MKPHKEEGITDGGWSSAADAKIRELLGLSEGQFLRGGYDLDLFDTCRWHWEHPEKPIPDGPDSLPNWRKAVELVLAEWGPRDSVAQARELYDCRVVGSRLRPQDA